MQMFNDVFVERSGGHSEELVEWFCGWSAGRNMSTFCPLCSAVPQVFLYISWRDGRYLYSLSNSPQLICGLK